jgi:raffinose/stachyose/melibiose transport system permease protein
MIPTWNDLWWPLVIAPSRQTATLTLGIQHFLGQFVSRWNAVLAALTAAPMLVLYALFSRQLIPGLMGGASK